MILFKKTAELHNYIDQQHKKGINIGFVPTMGALHKGHISLIEASVKQTEITVCSIFINPAQFNDPKDFEKYPVTIEKDIYELESAGCDILFLPSIEEVFPGGIKLIKHYELGNLEIILEGKFRPGHFQGVCKVVQRLLDIIHPDNLYLGQKDYQQCLVIKKLLEIINQDEKIKIIVCPTLREVDGLAMSSRNLRLSNDERKKATAIFQSLTFIKENLSGGKLGELKKQAEVILLGKDFRIDYIEIAEARSLEILNEWDRNVKIIALIAAFMNGVRLIDNMPLN